MKKVTGIITSLLEIQLIKPATSKKRILYQKFPKSQNQSKIKHPSQTVNDILGRINNVNTIYWIKHGICQFFWGVERDFNEYFSNIGPKLAQTIERDSANFEDFVIKRWSANQFSFEVINKLADSKSLGLGKISTKVLQIAAPAVAQPLTKIFNKSITLGVFH